MQFPYVRQLSLRKSFFFHAGDKAALCPDSPRPRLRFRGPNPVISPIPRSVAARKTRLPRSARLAVRYQPRPVPSLQTRRLNRVEFPIIILPRLRLAGLDPGGNTPTSCSGVHDRG